MGFAEIIETVYAALAIQKDCESNGKVNTVGYTEDGRGIGGHYTHDAMACLAEADEMLESVGVPRDAIFLD